MFSVGPVTVSATLRISDTGSSARSTLPLRAMPETPVPRISAMSPQAMPPMASNGMPIPPRLIRATMSL